MSDNEDKITQFIDITGCNRDRAEFYLSSANYEIEPALSSFYEAENDEIAVNIDADVVETPPQPDVAQETIVKPTNEKRTKKAGNFATLQTLDDSSDEEDDKGQAFYAGGSEHGSGQQIINPNKKNPIRDMVSNIFQSAQAGNMETFDPSSGGAGGGPSSSRFSGTGYRLGETESDTVAIRTGPSSAAGGNSRQGSDSCDTVTVKVWRQGFSVDDGELRPYDDPRNKEFFDCIMRNEIPPEFRKKGARTVHLNVEDHLHEEFVKKAPRFKAFTGSGHTLGSPTPTTAQEATLSSSISSPPVSTGNPAESEARAVSQLSVDQNQPTTMIQIRLADGSRLSAQFNVSHTVDDIRTYVSTARPQYASQNFTLLTTFPNKELTDGSETIEKAGLKNAAILQRLK